MKMTQPTHESSRNTFSNEQNFYVKKTFTNEELLRIYKYDDPFGRDITKLYQNSPSSSDVENLHPEVSTLFAQSDPVEDIGSLYETTEQDFFNSNAAADAAALALEEELGICYRIYNYMASWLRSAGLRVRDIGISIRRDVENSIDAILAVIKNFFSGTTEWIFNIIKSVTYRYVNEIYATAHEKLSSVKGKICAFIGVVIAALSVTLSKSTIGYSGRVLLFAMGAIISYCQSYALAGGAMFLLWIQSKFVSTYGFHIDIQNDVHTEKAKTQGFKEDTKALILDIVSLSVLVSAGTTGLELPSDAKSWDALLKRHSALHRCFTAWEFGADKVTDIFDRVSRYVFKYLLGKEYTSFDHISEIEELYEQVLGLSRLDMRINIGRDPQLAINIQNMYLKYLTLSKVYSNNRLVMSKLNKLGGPLTDYYRQVADKNPKAHVMRKEPVCIALFAPTGTGKSYLMARMQQDLLKISGRFDENIPLEGMIYARAVEQEFWDGYAGQPVVVYDDFGQKVDSTTSPNLEFFEIIRAINIFPYQLHCAALAEKANNPFNSEFVVLTTNLSNFKPVSIISTEAFIRRIHLNVKISLIDEVKSSGEGCSLDVEKLLAYQTANNLPTHDMSHLRFTTDDQVFMTYDEFIVKVSLEYKKHHEAFTRRQESNQITAPTSLPPGAFSLTDRWVARTQGIENIKEKLSAPPRFFLKRLNDFRDVVSEMYDRRQSWAHDLAFDLEMLREHFLDRHKTLIATLGFLGICVSGIAIFCQGKIFITSLENKAEVESGMEQQQVKQVTKVESGTKVQVKPKVFVESPMRVATTSSQVKVERKSIHDVNTMFNFESGRSYDDSTRKRTNLEGIRCEQLETIKSIARRNLWLMICEIAGVPIEIGFLTVLKGRKALLNFHYLQTLSKHWKNKGDKEFVLKFTQPNMQGGHSMELEAFVGSAKPVYRGLYQTEFYLVDMPKTINLGRDLTHHMITPDKAGKLMKGLPLQLSSMRRDDFGLWTPICVAGPLEKIALVDVTDDVDPNLTHTYLESVYYGAPTKGGDCGNPIFIDSNEFNKKLLGFHFAGQAGRGIASIITYNDVKDMLEDEMSLCDPQGINLSKSNEDFPLQNSSFYVQGTSVHQISHPCKSSVRPSLVHGLFGETEMMPARLAPPLTPDGPMFKAILKNAGDVKEMSDVSIMQEIKSDYYKHNIAPYFPTELETSVLDFETACRGVEGNMYMPPIKRGKSAGYPYMATCGKGKTDFFGTDEWDFSSDECKKLKTDVAIMVNRAAKGEVPEAVFVATLKDEKRVVEKVQQGKTRVFSACPQHFLIAFRMYFAGFICFMTRNRIGNESAIGTNAHGYDWKEIVRNISPWSEQNIAAGDFADFDGTFHPQMFELICSIINSFYNDSERNQQVRRALWAALANPLHLMGYWIFSFSHGQPSGSPITALSNSMYVSLCVRRIFFKILKANNMAFRKHVRVIAYGDDSLISLSPVFAKMITPFDIMNLFKNELGMNYTSATKRLYTPEDGYETINEVSFLKRGFSFDSTTGHWFAPLELRSIREMCNWIKKCPSPYEATMNNCNDALKELCHHPKPVFNQYREIIGEGCKEHSIVLDVPDWAGVRFAMSQGQIDYISENRPFV